MWRVQTQLSGPAIVGGGISTMFFDGAGLAVDAHSAVASFWQAIPTLVMGDNAGSVLGEIALVRETDGQILQIESAPPVAIDFTGTGEVSSLATQGLIRWRTSAFVDGREIRGRTFIPGPPEAFNVGGRPNASYMTALNDAAAALGDDPNSTLVVWRRPRPEQDPPDPEKPARVGTFAVVTAVSAWQEWATLRSRRD